MFVHVWFSELSVMYDIFFHVRAVDADQGNNAAIRYAIIGGNTQGQFSIDSVSGEVSLVKPLDYETLRSYRLVIRAQGKLPEWNWWHLVTIFVTHCLWMLQVSACEWSEVNSSACCSNKYAICGLTVQKRVSELFWHDVWNLFFCEKKFCMLQLLCWVEGSSLLYLY